MEPELHSMVATLCSYEALFGPYHSQTLRLMIEVGAACVDRGQYGPAECLLERAIKDLGRVHGREHDARLRGIAILRNLCLSRGDFERAGSLQRELAECRRPEMLTV
jgi:hypothetical protein